MDIKTFQNIKKRAMTFTYHSFSYIDDIAYLSYELLYDQQEGIILRGFIEDHEMYHILWATHDISFLLKYLHLPKTIFMFIPKLWKDQLLDHGMKEYGILREYWKVKMQDIDGEVELSDLNETYSQAISDVTKECLLESREFHGESKTFVENWILEKDSYLREIKAKHTKIFGYFHEKELIGVVFLTIYGENKMHKKTLWIRELAVKRAYQHQGIGRKLMKNALQYGKLHAVDRAFLMADDLNIHAIKLYQSFGFVPHMEDEQIDLITPDTFN